MFTSFRPTRTPASRLLARGSPAAAEPWLVSCLTAFLTPLDVDRAWLFAVENDLFTLANALERLTLLSTTRAKHAAMADASWTALRKLSGVERSASEGRYRLKKRVVDSALAQLARLDVSLAPNPDRRLAMLTTAAPRSVPAFVMYVAAHRGNLESVVWLDHEPHVADYNPVVALRAAGSCSQAAVVSWLLDMWSGMHSPSALFSINCLYQFRDDPALGVMAWTVRGNGAMYPELHVLTKKWGYFRQLREPRDVYPVMDLAAEYGDLEMLKRLHSHHVFSKAITEAAVDHAAKNGHIPVIEWLYIHHQQLCKDSTALHEACINGHLDLAQWLHDHAMINIQDSTFGGVIHGGHLHILEWISDVLPDVSRWYVNSLVERAAGSEQLQIVRWLVEAKQLPVAVSAVDDAAFTGNLELTKWLASKLEAPLPPSVLESAAHSGNRELIQLLMEDKQLWSENSFVSAARSSDIDAIQYLSELKMHSHTSRESDVLHIKGTWIYCGYFKTLLWLLDHSFCRPMLEKYRFDQIYSRLRALDRVGDQLGWEDDHTDGFEWEETAENLAQLHLVIEKVVQHYDPSFLTKITWLPK